MLIKLVKGPKIMGAPPNAIVGNGQQKNVGHDLKLSGNNYGLILANKFGGGILEGVPLTINPLIFSVNTQNTGPSNDDQFTLPLLAGATYNFIATVDGVDQPPQTTDVSPTYTFAVAGVNTLTIRSAAGNTSGFPTVFFNDLGDKLKLIDVVQWGDLVWSGVLAGAFFGCNNMTATATDRMAISGVTSMLAMFGECSSLVTLDVSGWNTSQVVDMSFMFFNCTSLATLDVSNWDTGSVVLFTQMFLNCSSLTVLDVSGFDTSSGTTMQSMFQGCTSLLTLDVSNWDNRLVTDMAGIFAVCSALTTIDLTGFNTSACTTMVSMFQDSSSLSTVDVSSFNTSLVITMDSMFKDCDGLVVVPGTGGWNTGAVTNMNGMFIGCVALSTVDVSTWNVGAVTGMSTMFANCFSLATLNVSSWNTGSVVDMGFLFNSCTSLAVLDVALWNTGSVTTLQNTFFNCPGVAVLAVDSWNTSSVIVMQSTFNLCTLADPDVSGWNIVAMTNATTMFTNSGFGDANYDLLLVAWEGQTHNNNVTFSAGSAQYDSAGAPGTARGVLVSTDSWTISDGGAQ